MTSTKDLTPIRVPGKNTRIQRRKLPGAAAARPRGRPMKATKDLKTTRSTASSLTPKQKKPRSLKHIKSKRSMSLLEKLPTELLERVFLFSMELNLPRASPVIAAKLSSDHIYTKCLITAFGPFWQKIENWDNNDSPKDIGWDVDRDELLDNELNSEEQSAILRCRWATLERLRSAEKTWLRRKEREIGAKLPPDLPERYESISQDFFDDDYAKFVDSPLSFFASRGSPLPLLRFRSRTVHIPSSLLNGPWTDEKIKHLFYLCQARAEVERYKSTAQEEAKEGLHSAILSGNIYAVLLLQELGTYIPLTLTLIKEFLSRNSDSLSPEIMAAFLRYFERPFQRYILPIQNIRALPEYYDAYDLNPENESAFYQIKAEVEREVLQMKRQAEKEDNHKLSEWADVIESIYGHPSRPGELLFCYYDGWVEFD